MSKITKYAPYIPLLTGFHITSARHIDNRMVQETIADMNDLSPTRLPDGIECLIMEAVRAGDNVVRYRWYDGVWHPITCGGGSGGGDDFNWQQTFVTEDWQLDVSKPYNNYYIEVAHTGDKYPSHMVFDTIGTGVKVEYKEISTSIFRLYCRHPFDGTLTAN